MNLVAAQIQKTLDLSTCAILKKSSFISLTEVCSNTGLNYINQYIYIF